MKKIIIIIVTFFVAIALKAQTIPYEKLDSISTEISKLQLKANNLPYKDAKGNEYEISFSDKNFEVFFYNQLAYKTVYKKWDGKEILALTENIDLSKVTAITKHTSFTDVILVKLYFPTGYLKTQLFENGIPTNTNTEEYLEFFTTNLSREKLANSLYDLVVLFKITKGLTTAEKIEEENEYYKSHSEEEFLDKYPLSLKAKQSKLIIKEKEEKIKKGEEYFMNYVYFKYYKIGLTLEQAKIEIPEYFSSYSTNKYKDQPTFDRAYSSKNSGIGLKLYGKNGKIVGCYGTIQGRVQDDAEFTKGNKAISDLVNELTAKFNFSPTKTVTPYNQDGYKYNYNSYTWEKNGKNVIIIYTQWYFSNGYTTDISLTQFDNLNDNRWGDNPQDNAINPIKSENSNSKNNPINLLKSVNKSSVNNTKTNTTTPITETSTLDEKAEYNKAKIDYKAGTISKDDYKAAMKKYSEYASYESIRLQNAFRDKEITRAEYTQALKILLRK